ncbi:MAG: hypothetical protein WBC91_25350 [Phototrophicaceae bacterium]
MNKVYVSLIALLIVIVPILADQDSDAEQNHGFNIVYFIAEDAEVDDIISPAAMQERFNADIVHRWEQLVFYDEFLGIDGLIIHVSVVDRVEDSAWFIRQYELGMTLTAFNVLPETFSDLVGNEGYDDRYELIEGDVVFITANSFSIPEILDGTGLGGVAIRGRGGNRVNRLSTAEGRFVLNFMIDDIRQNQQAQRQLMDELLD